MSTAIARAVATVGGLLSACGGGDDATPWQRAFGVTTSDADLPGAEQPAAAPIEAGASPTARRAGRRDPSAAAAGQREPGEATQPNPAAGESRYVEASADPPGREMNDPEAGGGSVKPVEAGDEDECEAAQECRRITRGQGVE